MALICLDTSAQSIFGSWEYSAGSESFSITLNSDGTCVESDATTEKFGGTNYPIVCKAYGSYKLDGMFITITINNATMQVESMSEADKKRYKNEIDELREEIIGNAPGSVLEYEIISISNDKLVLLNVDFDVEEELTRIK